MNVLSLYHDLKARGVNLEAAGEHLKVDAPAGVVTDEDRAALVEFKPILLRFLSRSPEEEPLRESKARWSGPGLIRILDPFTGEWHEWPAAKCLPGVVAEADVRRKGAQRERGQGGHDRAVGLYYEGGHFEHGGADSMTDRRDDWQKRAEEDERRREERERRYEELREAWRRNHPGEQEQGGKDRPKKGRPA